MKKSHGITLVQYHQILKDQSDICAICGAEEAGGQGLYFHVDHDHNTGKIRGLLCHACNTGIGLLRDSVPILLSAIAYLSESIAEVKDAMY